MSRRRAAALAGATASPLVLSGCSVVDGIGGSGSAPPVPVDARRARRPGPEPLAPVLLPAARRGPTARAPECADLEVPVDYDNPPGRHHRAGAGQGPGHGAVEADRVARRQPRRARRLRRRLRPGGRLHRRQGGAPRLRRRRASTRGASGAPRRSTASPTPSSTPSSAPTRRPTTPPRSRRFAQPARGFAEACGRNAGPLLGARVDRGRRPRHGRPAGRARRGEAHLPRQVLRHLPRRDLRRPLPASRSGRMVLDGVVAPDLTTAEINLGQAEGFELRHPRVGRLLRRARATARSASSVDAGHAGPARPSSASVDAEPAAAHRRQRRARGSPRGGPRSASPRRCTTRASWQIAHRRDARGRRRRRHRA